MFLADAEQRMLDGHDGAPRAQAMAVLSRLGEACGADRMVPIASAHLVASSYQIAGEAGIAIYGDLVAHGARVAVRTTSDPGSIDFARWQAFKTPADYAARQIVIAELLDQMGVIPTWTCTPYTTFNVPRFGEHLGWSESSAVVFANSVVGARTNRLAAYVDLCAALAGRVPYFGLHTDAGRTGDILFEIAPDLAAAFEDHYFPPLGYLVGQVVKDKIPVIRGVPGATFDQLKAFGAASAASGSVALYHMVGITPEAPTVEAAFRGEAPRERIPVGLADITATMAQMGGGDGPIDVVGVGCPHASIDQMRRYAAFLDGKRVHANVQLWVCTNTTVEQMARTMGYAQTIERAGGRLMVGTCHNDCPLAAWGFRRLATDSGKFAYYTPTTVGTECLFAGTDACLQAAVTGKVER
ncbi:MAG TPA: aconitase X catalytic domain-containing protein [Candidatus Baltobacteraceae bacterium]|nr:aconitase X catalytic domain-containing protein [Candidatus Baltobacteraceae bacterium]